MPARRHPSLVLFVLLVALLSLAACSQTSPDSNDPTDGSSNEEILTADTTEGDDTADVETDGDGETETGDDEALINPADEGLIELATTGRQVVHVNFDGVTIDDCENYCSDAPTNRSWAIGEHFGQSSVAFAAYAGGQAARDQIMSKLRAAFADYNIEFVTTRPASGPFTMLIISPSNAGPNHGVAPLNCNNTNASDVAFVYKIGNSSTTWIAQAGAHELGHSFGLAHVRSSSAIMQWASSGSVFVESDYDTGHPSGKCFNGDVQDGPAMLREALGPVVSEPTFQGTFADDDGSVHEAGIEAIVAENITVGCQGGEAPRFCPERSVTRAQMVVFLYRALDLPDSSHDHFSDDNGAWYEYAANAVAEQGITTGCGDGNFCGENELSRGQMAAFLHRAFDLPPATQDYFSDDDGTTFEDSINRVAAAGITTGCNGGGEFCPQDKVSRAQMATFLARALGIL